MRNTLKIQRAKKNITQEQLAQEIGVSRQTINAMELGKYVPSTLLALKTARYFSAKVEDILMLEKGRIKWQSVYFQAIIINKAKEYE